jgi:hypothetical protein
MIRQQLLSPHRLHRVTGILVLTLLGCSNLTGDSKTPIAIEIRIPAGPPGFTPVVEIGDTLQLSARALNQAGDSVDASFVWLTPDTATLALDSLTGRFTGKAVGTGRVQVRSGSLSSDLLTFSVVPAADSLMIVLPDSFRVLTTDTATLPLVAELDTINPTGPLAGRQIVYVMLQPFFGQPGDTASLNGGTLSRLALTGINGEPTTPVYVRPIPGQPRPDSVFVEVRAFRPSGAVIPGTGQRFIIRFD